MTESSANSHKADAFTQPLIEQLRRHPKRIVFPDGNDLRVLQVARELVRLEAAIPLLLGSREEIKALAALHEIDLSNVRVLDPARSCELDLFCERLSRIERYRGVELSNAREIISRPLRFAAMMTQYGHADAIVAGNTSVPAAIFRALLHLVKPLPNVPRVFSAVAAVAPHLTGFGKEGVLFLADCGLNVEPAVEELASFGVETGKLAHHYLGRRSRVVFLSHSTKGSSQMPSARKVEAATNLARQQVLSGALDMDVDGELQLDVALDPAAAEIKLPGQELQQSPDVLIFPNLDAGHIALKLLDHVAGARIYGQLILGLARPAAQVTRTVDFDSLLGTALAVGVEAIKYHQLYPDGEVG